MSKALNPYFNTGPTSPTPSCELTFAAAVKVAPATPSAMIFLGLATAFSDFCNAELAQRVAPRFTAAFATLFPVCVATTCLTSDLMKGFKSTPTPAVAEETAHSATAAETMIVVRFFMPISIKRLVIAKFAME